MQPNFLIQPILRLLIANLRAIKISVIALLVVSTVGATFFLEPGRSAPASVAIKDACSTFVKGYKLMKPAAADKKASLLELPAIRTGKQGLELVISFTPTKNPEARAVFDAVSAGTRTLVVFSGQHAVQAVGIEDGYLVLAANSSVHAKEILQMLCFEGNNKAVNTDTPKAASSLP